MGDGPPETFGGTKYLGVTSLHLTFLNWRQMKERHILEIFDFYMQVRPYPIIVSAYSLFRADVPLITASGDLRNVVKTIAHLPKSYNQSRNHNE
jgi:hypothetical protein